MAIHNKKKLGELLVDLGIINESNLESVLLKQNASGKKLGELIVEEGLASESQILEVLEFQLRIPRIDFNQYAIDYMAPRLISEELARKHLLIPVQKEKQMLVIAAADPLNLYAIDDVRIATGLEIKTLLASKSDVINAIGRFYGKESAEKAAVDFENEYSVDDISEMENELLDEVNNAPAVRFVNSIIQHAARSNASDIHIEPFDKYFRIRFRIDGELQEIMRSAKHAYSAVVTRMKIMGRLDIAEKRLPQDGRVEMQIDERDIDLRISILPTAYGEKIVIRLLGGSEFTYSKEQLGFSKENIYLFEKIIKNPNGIILVTGPTGSGKSTTLYTVLKELNEINRNIITVEDPIEYKLEGINQVQVNNKAGLTFANGLRSILRQDPDIIMIGEIRDSETAEISVRAAITGHLVLSTMHTNDSAATVSRLIDMGVEPYLVSSSVVGIIAQRLVRKICSNCRTPYHIDHYEAKLLGMEEGQTLYKGKGCRSCNNTGYKGRTAIHEVMLINHEIRELIDKGATIDQLREASVRNGTRTLRESCKRIVEEGITTAEEMLRITYSMD